MDPESSLGPGSPKGPISFNSSALLRVEYIRMNADLGPWRAMNTHDPHRVAKAIYESPHLELNHKIRRAVLYSAHALRIPVKIGVNIVTRNQAFAWSLQRSLCALECAFVLSKCKLMSMQNRIAEVPLDEEESRLVAYINDMVAEADPGFRASNNDRTTIRPDLCTRVIKLWAKIWSGEAVWDVVRLVGKTLESHSQILERQSTL